MDTDLVVGSWPRLFDRSEVFGPLEAKDWFYSLFFVTSAFVWTVLHLNEARALKKLTELSDEQRQ